MVFDPVLVTGATGLLGNNLARALLAQGRTVRALVRDPATPRSLEDLDVEIVHGDICDTPSVRAACRGMRAVIHAAGYVQLGRSQLDLHRRINVEGTRSIAEAARHVGARLVHVSSVDALGVRSVEHPADEETPLLSPVRCSYVISKREAEDVVLQEVKRGLDAVVVNPGFMLGPWDWKPSSGRMLLAVARGKGLFAPHGYYSVCDARDVAVGMLAALERGGTGKRYILAGENMTYFQAWRVFAEVSGGRKPIASVRPGILRLVGRMGDLVSLLGTEPDVNSGAISLALLPSCFSSARAEAELDYVSRPLRESAQDAWNWFQEYGYV
jgi:dihydroflavonol-4-reductase